MSLSRRHVYAYLVLAAVVVALGVRYVVAPPSSGPAAAETLVLAPAASPSPSASAAPADVVVYVCGAVESPGVIRLPADARVADAVALAGGATAGAELAAVNLAARVVDGQQILVPERGSAPPAAVAAPAAAGGALVNINTATLEQLDALEGVGPATAQKIIDYRTEHGGFTTIDELKNVPGIGDAKFAAVQDSITI